MPGHDCMWGGWWTQCLYVLVILWILTSAALTVAYLATNQDSSIRTPTYVFAIGTLAVVGLGAIYYLICRWRCPNHNKMTGETVLLVER